MSEQTEAQRKFIAESNEKFAKMEGYSKSETAAELSRHTGVFPILLFWCGSATHVCGCLKSGLLIVANELSLQYRL